MKIHKDFLGNEVKVGDFIFHSTTGRFPESKVSVITKFTGKSLFAKTVKSNRNYFSKDETVVRNSFVLVCLKHGEDIDLV